jgi:hypothetical protein
MLIGYARVSKGDAQTTALQLRALAAHGVTKIYKEHASGGRWDRLRLHAMIEHLREGDVVVVWKLDRLSRSLKDLLHILDRIEAAGAGFRSLTEAIDTTTPAGRMMMQMVGAFAEFERAMIRERVMAGLSAAAPRPLRRCALQEDAGQTPARAGGDGKSRDQGWQALPRDRRLQPNPLSSRRARWPQTSWPSDTVAAKSALNGDSGTHGPAEPVRAVMPNAYARPPGGGEGPSSPWRPWVADHFQGRRLQRPAPSRRAIQHGFRP